MENLIFPLIQHHLLKNITELFIKSVYSCANTTLSIIIGLLLISGSTNYLLSFSPVFFLLSAIEIPIYILRLAGHFLFPYHLPKKDHGIILNCRSIQKKNQPLYNNTHLFIYPLFHHRNFCFLCKVHLSFIPRYLVFLNDSIYLFNCIFCL